MKIELSDSETETILQALTDAADGLTAYTRWVDDRPMLPEREVAVARIRQQSLDMKRLWLKIYDARKEAAQ